MEWSHRLPMPEAVKVVEAPTLQEKLGLKVLLLVPICWRPRPLFRIQGGRLVTVSVPASIKIERNGVRATLAAFKAGDRVQARFLNNATTKFEGVGR